MGKPLGNFKPMFSFEPILTTTKVTRLVRAYIKSDSELTTILETPATKTKPDNPILRSFSSYPSTPLSQTSVVTSPSPKPSRSRVVVVKNWRQSPENKPQNETYPAITSTPENHSRQQPKFDRLPVTDRPQSTTVAGLFKISTFTGEDPENENPSKFIKPIEYSFTPVASKYTTSELHIDVARALFFQSHTSLTAEKWVQDVDESLLEDWTLFKAAFVRRFPMKEKHKMLHEALEKFSKLKQNGRRLSDYYTEVRFFFYFVEA